MKDKRTVVAQSDRFEKAAREIECDENEKAFDDKLRRIAKPKGGGDDQSHD